MELRHLAAERRDPHRVLEQPAGVAVVTVRRGGEGAERRADLRVACESLNRCGDPRMVKLTSQELEEAVELLGIASQRRRELRRVCLGRRFE